MPTPPPKTLSIRRVSREEAQSLPGAAPATSRLNKRMAELGLCSRREADAWIEQGWVRVNGQVAGMGMQVSPSDRITVEKAAEAQQQQQVTILLHKPMGYVSGQAEDGHQPAVTLIQARNHWNGDLSRTRFSPAQLRGLAPAGRLDIDSTGLLVLTQDGRVARQLIGEDSVMEKEYLVRVAYTGHENTAAASRASATYGGKTSGQLSAIGEHDRVSTNVQAVFPAAQLQRLRHGLSLDGKPLKPAKVVAKPRAIAFCAHRRQEAPDPPHVRTGGAQGRGAQAHPHGACDLGSIAGRPVALPGAARALLTPS